MVESWLFIGNPGVGKSTLLNCLAQRAVFASGVSYGGGLTRDVQTCIDHHHEVVYTDTPGLADPSSERTAARAITRALRTSGPRIKLCFVVRLENGRVMSQDVATMERVLDSIAVPEVPFGILINCVSVEACKTLSSDNTAFRRVITLANSGKYKTPHVLLVPEYPELVDEDDKIVRLPEDVRASIHEIPTALIPHDAVISINVDDFQASADKLHRTMSTLQADGNAMAKAQNELTQHKSEFWKIARKGAFILAKVVIFVVLL